MRKFIKIWAAPALCGLLILVLFRYVLFIGYVPSESMEPTISSGSYIIGHRIIGEIQRGDILVFRHDGLIMVKRVAAVAGDLVFICESGNVFVNAEPPVPIKVHEVPENSFFMLGDNADSSVDSGDWNEPFIRRGQIIAKLWQ